MRWQREFCEKDEWVSNMSMLQSTNSAKQVDENTNSGTIEDAS